MSSSRYGIAWTVFLATALAVGPALAAPGELGLRVGQSSLADDGLDRAGVDSVPEIGLTAGLDLGWPVMLVGAVLWASDDATQDVSGQFPLAVDTEAESFEVDLGVRRVFRKKQAFRPYVGGGVAWLQLDVEQVQRGSFGPGTEFTDTVLDDDDSGVGYWLGGGLEYRLRRIHFGVDLRFSRGSADLEAAGGGGSLEFDTGGMSLGAFTGVHW